MRESEVEPLFRQLDISNHGSIHRLSNFLLDTYGGLDILVNNAGVMYPVRLFILCFFSEKVCKIECVSLGGE